MTDIVQFRVGRTYSDCHTGDAQLFEHFTILARTAKTVTVEVHGKVVRRGVYVWNGVEQFKPFGNYSMAMIVNANDKDLSPALPKPARPLIEEDKIRAQLAEAKPALDYAKAVREQEIIKVDVAEALKLAEAAKAMLAALKELLDDVADVDAGKLPRVSSATLTRVRQVIAQAEAAGIKVED